MEYGNYRDVACRGVKYEDYFLKMHKKVDDGVRELMGSISFVSVDDEGNYAHPSKLCLDEKAKLSELEDFVWMIWDGVEKKQRGNLLWIVGRSVSITRNHGKIIDLGYRAKSL